MAVKNRTRRLKLSRFIILSISLVFCVAISSKANGTWKDQSLLGRKLGYSTVNCTCQDCFIPEDYKLTCCQRNSSMCVTAHGKVCSIRQLCVAELIPGGSGGAECLHSWELQGGIALYIFLLLYIFLGLAIVCDDYFVPSLEKISDGLSLSEDVAGATFMAAGSSAPELFVSLADNVIANPPKSIGIGTIIGSAIFNILVIIGLSAALAGQSLALDWRPLTRDSFFYTLSIVLMIIVVYDGSVSWWEGLILLFGYFAYVTFMIFNQKFFDQLDRLVRVAHKKNIELPEEDARVESDKGDDVAFEPIIEHSDSTADNAVELALENGSVGTSEVVEETNEIRNGNGPQPFSHTVETSRPAAAVAAVESVRNIKRHGSDPQLIVPDTPGLKRRLMQNPLHRSKSRLDWSSMGRESQESKRTLRDVAQVIMRANAVARSFQDARGERNSDENGGKPAALRLPSADVDDNEDDADLGPYWECLMWPVTRKGNGKKRWIVRACSDWVDLWQARLWYLIALPLNLLFRTTIPDCSYDLFCEDKAEKEENRKIGYSLTFIMCIVWIAVLSHFVTYSAAKFGCIVGISPPVMGLTILAAGTSIPDAISSIIVARNGQGDMAVANSLGSNVFDILIGLGFPWFIAEFVYDRPSAVRIDDLAIGISFLFGVLILLLVIVILNKWVLQKRIGFILLALYLVYVLFELFLRPLVVS